MKKIIAFIVAFSFSVVSVVLFFFCLIGINSVHRPLDLSKPIFKWEYKYAVIDHLPVELSWVRNIAFSKHVDDEGAFVSILNVCGNSIPEVVFYYQRDGIIFTNTTALEVYSYEGKPLKQEDNNKTILYSTVSAINPRNGLIFHDIGFPFINIAYYFSHGKYHATWLMYPLHMICRYAISFGLFFFSPCNIEMCLLFLILQYISFILVGIVFHGKQRFEVLLKYGLIRMIILIFLGVLYSIPAIIFPWFLIIGAFLGSLMFAIIAMLPFERWIKIRD